MQLEAKNISFSYSEKSEQVLKNINIEVKTGERVAILGPSGCGKSTLAKILSGYMTPNEGEVLLDGQPLPQKGFCPVQMIYQHPELSVNPRHKMAKILNEAWTPDALLLKEMGIENEWLSRWPSELSSGELQRFCIARALAPETKFLICDEISTMLDVITQAQIWKILLDVADKNELGLVVVTHNRALAQRVCQRTVDFQNDFPCDA
ncbi:MAG: ATP-binding cassette domain-containing protein [Clostridiaceae bacterium]|nr:ATP-binding cassette domain-containing protein [Clostridiaceae bacterium]